ncbi:hypothetical protein P691DRAFT_69925 [Macrolepiota fuliginosa MF-IS2]|uniref:Uncharacterized protein n=1 Tax=Macrolepiota fuliginosa MF-IS2 TaxID=1400762 RepID=A0A9P5XD63_9AGAR|nr:hypothetical protein P691DRAFT_69925 [Macrolepiota fuliginosa MF-IS2]
MLGCGVLWTRPSSRRMSVITDYGLPRPLPSDVRGAATASTDYDDFGRSGDDHALTQAVIGIPTIQCFQAWIVVARLRHTRGRRLVLHFMPFTQLPTASSPVWCTWLCPASPVRRRDLDDDSI